MADLLRSLNVPADDAYEVVFRRMPGRATRDWWHSEFLPRFGGKDRAVVAEQIERYFEAAGASADRRFFHMLLTECAIIKVVQQEMKLSATASFHLWQLGLPNQTEDWWRQETARLSPAGQKEINELRQDFRLSTERSITPAPATSTSLSAETQAKIAKWNTINPDTPASEQMGPALQAVEDAITSFVKRTDAVKLDTPLASQSSVAALKDQLNALKNSATRLVAATNRQKEQMVVELRRTRSSPEEQRLVVAKTAEGYRLMEAWAASAHRAADAGITMCDLLDRNLPADDARQHFVKMWKASSEVQEEVAKRAARFFR